MRISKTETPADHPGKRGNPCNGYDAASLAHSTLADLFATAFEAAHGDIEQTDTLMKLAVKVSRKVTDDGSTLRYYFRDGSSLHDE